MTLMMGASNAVHVRRILSFNPTNRTTFGSENSAGGLNHWYPRPIYLRMLCTSSTSVTMSYSLDGLLWSTYSPR